MPRSNFYVITGPLASGKSTFKYALCEKLKTGAVSEYPFGIDIDKPDWWNKLISYVGKRSKVIETHFCCGGKDSCDNGAELVNLIIPPAFIKIYVVLPDVNVLLKQQLERDSLTSLSETEIDHKWYMDISKEFKKNLLAYRRT